MEITKWWFSYSKLTMLAIANFYVLSFDWFDNESIGDVVFAVDIIDIRGLIEVLKDSELRLYFDITADLHLGNTMGCVNQHLIF